MPIENSTPQQKKYELSFLWEGRVHFAIVRAVSVQSAAERIMCQPVDGLSFVQSQETGHWFVTDPKGDRWCIAEVPEYEPVSEVVPDCKPHISELPRKARPSMENILASIQL